MQKYFSSIMPSDLLMLVIFAYTCVVPLSSCKAQTDKKAVNVIQQDNKHPYSFILEYPITKNGRLSQAYQNVIKTVQNFKLDSLQKGYDSLQIRIWTGHALDRNNHILIIKEKQGSYEAELITLTEQNDSIKKTVRPNLKPSSGWRSLVSGLLQEEILSLPAMMNIPGYEGGFADGALYGIEVATPNLYRFYYYWCPEYIEPKYKQAGNIRRILETVDREFGIKLYYRCQED